MGLGYNTFALLVNLGAAFALISYHVSGGPAIIGALGLVNLFFAGSCMALVIDDLVRGR